MESKNKGTPGRVPAIPKAVEKMAESATALATLAEEAKITTPKMYEWAADTLRTMAERRKEVEAKQKELLAPINEAAKRLRDFFRAPLERLKRAEGALRSGIGAWDAEQRRLAIEKQAALQAEADRKAEEQRARLLAKAKEQKGKGSTAVKAELRDMADTIVAPTVHVAAPERKVQMRKVWSWEVTDANKVPIGFMIVHSAIVTAYVRANHDRKPIPGIRIFCKEVPVV